MANKIRIPKSSVIAPEKRTGKTKRSTTKAPTSSKSKNTPNYPDTTKSTTIMTTPGENSTQSALKTPLATNFHVFNTMPRPRQPGAPQFDGAYITEFTRRSNIK